MSFFSLRIISILFFLFFYGCGNSALHWIKDGDKIIVPGSEKVLSEKIKSIRVTEPSVKNPELILKFIKEKEISSTSNFKLKQIEKKWQYTFQEHLFRWTMGWFLLVPLWGYFIKGDAEMKINEDILEPPSTFEGEEKHTYNQTSFLVSWKPTGNTTVSDLNDDFISKSEILKDSEVTIRILNNEKKYSINEEGLLSINFVTDFQLISYEEDLSYVLTVIILATNDSINLSIDPRFWMVEYLSVEFDKVDVVGERNDTPVKIGVLKNGDKVRLLHKGSELWKIDFNGVEGFVIPNGGKIVWLVP